MSDVELSIPPRVEYLAVVRAVISAAAGLDPHISPERLDDIRLAVSEATTNAIEAHSRCDSAETIDLRCDLGDGQVSIEVHDRGTGFDPSKLVPHPPVTDPERLQFERGLGIPLMRRLMDEHEVHPSPQGTLVRLVVYTNADE